MDVKLNNLILIVHYTYLRSLRDIPALFGCIWPCCSPFSFWPSTLPLGTGCPTVIGGIANGWRYVACILHYSAGLTSLQETYHHLELDNPV